MNISLQVKDALRLLHPHNEPFVDWAAAHVAELWTEFAPLADVNFVTELCSGGEGRFYQRYWEMVLASHLRQRGFTLSSAHRGPDLRAEKDGLAIWFEAIAPGPGQGLDRLPDCYLNPDFTCTPTVAFMVPHNEILLRWTAAIREKYRKHVRYIEKGIVAPNDPYVIAVNSCLLGCEGFQGISDFPNAVEAVFPIGPMAAVIDRRTGDLIEERRVHRPTIVKANRENVPTNIFTSPEFAGITAVLGAHTTLNDVAIGAGRGTVMVHNPLARNKVTTGLVGADAEYVPEDLGNGYYKLTRS